MSRTRGTGRPTKKQKKHRKRHGKNLYIGSRHNAFYWVLIVFCCRRRCGLSPKILRPPLVFHDSPPPKEISVVYLFLEIRESTEVRGRAITFQSTSAIVFFSEKVTVLPSTVKELPSAASRHSFHLPCTVSNCSMYAVQDRVSGLRMHIRAYVHAFAKRTWQENGRRQRSRATAPFLRGRPNPKPLLLSAGGHAPEVLAPPLISLTCTICRLGYLRGRSAVSRHRRASPRAERSVEEGETGICERGGTQIVQCAARRHVRKCRGTRTCPRCLGMRAGRCARTR